MYFVCRQIVFIVVESENISGKEESPIQTKSNEYIDTLNRIDFIQSKKSLNKIDTIQSKSSLPKNDSIESRKSSNKNYSIQSKNVTVSPINNSFDSDASFQIENFFGEGNQLISSTQIIESSDIDRCVQTKNESINLSQSTKIDDSLQADNSSQTEDIPFQSNKSLNKFDHQGNVNKSLGFYEHFQNKVFAEDKRIYPKNNLTGTNDQPDKILNPKNSPINYKYLESDFTLNDNLKHPDKILIDQKENVNLNLSNNCSTTYKSPRPNLKSLMKNNNCYNNADEKFEKPSLNNTLNSIENDNHYKTNGKWNNLITNRTSSFQLPVSNEGNRKPISPANDNEKKNIKSSPSIIKVRKERPEIKTPRCITDKTRNPEISTPKTINSNLKSSKGTQTPCTPVDITYVERILDAVYGTSWRPKRDQVLTPLLMKTQPRTEVKQ